jgi:hypothetical protein
MNAWLIICVSANLGTMSIWSPICASQYQFLLGGAKERRLKHLHAQKK